MPNEEVRGTLNDFGGLVTTLTPRLLESGDATEAEFCELNDGILEIALGRRDLFAGVTAGTGEVTTIIYWRKMDGAAHTIICTTADIFRADFATSTFVSIKPAGYTVTGTRAWSWTYATIADKIVLTNGTDPPLEWDGVASTAATLTLPTGVTKPQFVLWWKNRLHLFNVIEGGVIRAYRHWWSAPGVYTDWSTANGAGFLDYTGGGEPIQGVADLENVVVLFKQTRVTTIAHTGLSAAPFAARDLDQVPGTYAPFSIQVTANGVFYLAVDGLRVFDGVQSHLVSRHVDAFSNIPITTLTKASSVLDRVFKRYLVALPSTLGGRNDTVWNVLYQFWPQERMEFSKRTYGTDVEIRALGKFIKQENLTWQSFPESGPGSTWGEQTLAWNDPKASGEFEELVAGGYAGQVWLYEDVATDLGAVVPFRWTSGVLPEGLGRATTRLLSVTVGVVRAVNSQVVLEILDAETDAVRFVATLDLSQQRTITVYPNRAFQTGFRLRFLNTAANSLIVIDEVRYVALVERRFRG